MNRQPDKKNAKRRLLRSWAALAGVLLVAAALLMVFPARRPTALGTAWGYLREMIAILPAVMILMGLFAVFVSQEQVVRYLGETSGIKGTLVSIILGALPTGPLYVAFPLAAALRRKGARTSNIIIFLSAWACIKIPQELVELQFLGWQFMVTRLLLTVAFVILMGLFVEKLMAFQVRKEGEGKHEGV